MQGSAHKAFLPLAGRPLVAWSLAKFADAPEVERAIVAVPPGMEEFANRLMSVYDAELPIEVVAGRATRAQSVRAAFKAAGDVATVLVHDAARPLLTTELITGPLRALEEWGCAAVLCAAPATDTIKESDDGENVSATLPRQRVWMAQTPQVFRADELRAAYEQVDDDTLTMMTDETQLIEATGGDVRIFPSLPDNLKVTTPVDMMLAELLIEARTSGVCGSRTDDAN